jgi:mRNA-degrading endonuclease RelE of RelBE toxin-antitoxin system
MRRTRNLPKRPYRVIVSPVAEKQLRKSCPAWLATAVVSFVWKDLRYDPTEFGDYGRKLSGKVEGTHCVKQKKFRLVYKLKEEAHVIEILEVTFL